MIKYFYASICCILSLGGFAQNVGVNNIDPKSALDVNGGIRLRPVTSLVSGTSVTLVSNHGYHFVSGTPTGNFSISLLPLPNEGQHTIITNTTAFTGNVFSIAIPPASTVELFYSNGGWKQIGSSQPLNNTVWSLTGNMGINPSSHFIGTTTDANLVFKRNSVQSGLIGDGINGNTSFGYASLTTGVTGQNNTALGISALSSIGAGDGNTASGAFALNNNVGGDYNTATGHLSSFANISGIYNTAVGVSAMQLNRFSSFNVAIGNDALKGYNSSTEESGNNVAIGAYALHQHGTGVENVAFGSSALSFNYIGSRNTAVGFESGERNYYGSGNIFLGYRSGGNSSNKLYIENSTNDSLSALIYGDFLADSLLLNAKTINKFSLNVRGANALEMGYGANNKQTDAGKICYGCFGDPAHWLGIVGGGLQANNGNDRVIKLWSEGGLRIRGNTMPDFGSTYTLGNTTMPWRSATTDSVRSNAYMLRNSTMHIVGATGELVFRLNNIDIAKVSSGGISPAADNDIYLGGPSKRFVSVYATIGVIQTSDANLKTNIQPTHYGLDEVLALNPVEYNWKENPSGEKMVGLLAQEVQKIIPEAVVTPRDGSPLGMKYNELIPVLVKAIQEQQKKIEELENALKKLQK